MPPGRLQAQPFVTNPSAPGVALAREEAFHDRILVHLRERGSDSISGIARALAADREHPVHRLTVAGYLAAMTELGVLRELPRPPSKHYQLADPRSHRSLYEHIGAAVRDVPMPAEQRTRSALAALVHLLGRPVFRAELAATRIPIPDDLPRAGGDPERARLIRARIARRPWPGLQVPVHDPLLAAPDDTGPVAEIVRRALLAACDSEHLAQEPPRSRQVPLPEIVLEGRD